MTWMQHHQQIKLQITTSAITDLCCLVRLHIIQKHGKNCLSSSSSSHDTRLFVSWFPRRLREKNVDFLISETFLSLVLFFPSHGGTLSDSSWTGILDAHHSKLLLFLWDVAPSLASPLGVLQAASSARGDVWSFYSVVKCHLTSRIFHLQTDFKVYSPAS